METANSAETKQNNLDLWEAWIDMQHSSKEDKGTLYIIGDILINNQILKPILVKKESAKDFDHELILEVIPDIVSEEGYQEEVFYSEELKTPNQYRSITIFSGNQVIARINEIEVLL